MVDLVALAIATLVVLAVLLRKSSAGVATLALLAGVMLDQLLSSWVIGFIPKDALSGNQQYVTVIINLLITFIPVVATLVAVKVAKHNVVLSLLTSLTLGFLIFYFGLKIVAPLPLTSHAAKNSGLLTFLSPYQNAILASAAVLALLEMIMSHHSKGFKDKKKKK